MGVGGGVVMRVAQNDIIAVAALPAHVFDRAAGRCVNWGAIGGGVVYALVFYPFAVQGVQSHDELGTDSSELDRVSHKCALAAASAENVRASRPGRTGDWRGERE